MEENKKEEVTVTKAAYANLLSKARAFELQTECFRQVRDELLPTEKDLHLPWYEMLAKCIKNRQLK